MKKFIVPCILVAIAAFSLGYVLARLDQPKSNAPAIKVIRQDDSLVVSGLLANAASNCGLRSGEFDKNANDLSYPDQITIPTYVNTQLIAGSEIYNVRYWLHYTQGQFKMDFVSCQVLH